MTSALIPLLAALGYLLATAWLVRDHVKEIERPRVALIFVLPALALQALAHGLDWHELNGPDLHFFSALSLVGLGMAALTTVAALNQRIEALGIVVYPLATIFLLLFHFYGHGKAENLDWRLMMHAWLALLAYATLAIAALLAGMLWFQERALRNRQISGWLRALPPLTQLESLLFRSLAASFFLLTLALVTGVLFVENLLAQHLWHKTVLSFLSWIVLATLLFGRWRYGWRGPRAVKLTLTAMALLLLAFFGSKFVLELVLNRG
jgi:ABC-type uncharacterized transport system permease subunit